MTLNCIIYTTVRNEADLRVMMKDCRKAREFLLKTPGRKDVTFTLLPFPSPDHVPTIKDSEGHTRPTWEWFKQVFRYVSPTDYTAVGLHFLPQERTKWGITSALNGSYLQDVHDDVLDFWLCATPGKKARNYPFSEIVRLLIHEIQHGDVHWTGAERERVHMADYDEHAIHELPLKLSYETWNLWKSLADAYTSLFSILTGKKKR